MAIDQIAGVAWASIDKVAGVAKANISKVAGVDAPSGSSGPVFRSATDAYSGTSGNSITGTKPTGTVEGDILIASVYWNDRNQGVTGPSGWTEIANFETGDPSASCSAWYKVAGSSEPADYTWNAGTVSRRGVTIATFSGSYAADPEDAAAVVTQADPESAGITTVGSNAMVVYCGSFDSSPSGTWGEDTGWTSAGADDGNYSTYIGYKLFATAGATGTIAYTFSGDDTDASSIVWSFVRDD